MKHTWRDGLTILCLALIAGLGAWVAWAAGPTIDTACGRLAAVGQIGIFCAVCGSATAVYLSILLAGVRLRPGEWRSRDFQSFLWKHENLIRNVGGMALKPFFPMFARPAYQRIMGLTLGKGVVIDGHIVDPRLTTLGDYVILGKNSCVTAHAWTYDRLVIEPVAVGTGVTVGANVVVMPGAKIGDYSVIAAGAVVTMGTEVPPGEMWGGVPARRIKGIGKADVTPEPARAHGIGSEAQWGVPALKEERP